MIVFGSEIKKESAMPRVNLSSGGVLDYKIRITRGLRQKLERAAKRSGLSANREMVHRLEQSFEDSSLISNAKMFEMLEKFSTLVTTAQTTYGHVSKLLDRQVNRNTAFARLLVLLGKMPERVFAAIRAADPEYLEQLNQVLSLDETKAAALELVE
jgi:hypothetical protein